tara:strand:- start:4074 stop:5699 length:1626 start_codon:yes stop_codon:yes gene_type:complete
MDSFFFLAIKFYFLFFLFTFSGRSLMVIFSKSFLNKKSDDIEIQGIDIQIFYPLIGMFLIGNYLNLINIFLPLKSNFSFLFLLILFINFYEKVNINKLRIFSYVSLLYLVLLVSSYDINFHYDAGLYHLNNQLWLLESNAIKGFSNIYGAFGVSSIHEYISAFLWLDTTFISLHFINLIFIGSLYFFLVYGLMITKNKLFYAPSLFLLLFSIFDNFGLSGGRNGFVNIQSVGKQDAPIGILFLITSALILSSLIKKSFSTDELLIYSLFALFIFQLKISGFAIIFIYSIYLYYFYLDKNKSIDKLTKPLSIYAVLFGLWIFKSLIHTGCLIFPFSSSCFTNLEWVNLNYIKTIEDVTVNFSSSYYFNSSFLDWANTYLDNEINFVVLSNYVISLALILIIKYVFFDKKKLGNTSVLVSSFVFFNILFLLRFGPDLRYLIGLQMLIIFIVGLYSETRINVNKYVIFFLLITSIILVPRLQSYKTFNFLDNPSIELPIQEMSYKFERLYPETGDQCWANIECSANRENYFIDDSEFFKKVLFK